MEPNTQPDPAQNPVTAAIPTPPTPIQPTSIPTQTTTANDLAAIEREVAKELGTTTPAPVTAAVETIGDKAKKLSAARAALEAKIMTLENDVKSKLATLKELKATLEDEISKIKELKATEDKIDAGLHKIEDLERKQAEIEHEITTIEETTRSL